MQSLRDICPITPDGSRAYVTNALSNTVSVIDTNTNRVVANPISVGRLPKAVAIAITPQVPFASSFAKLKISAKRFDLNGSFTLGTNSDGIDPVTENVTLQIGTFSVTIPAGSFTQNPNPKFAFKGVIDGVSLEAEIEGRGVRVTS